MKELVPDPSTPLTPIIFKLHTRAGMGEVGEKGSTFMKANFLKSCMSTHINNSPSPTDSDIDG